MDLRSSMMKSGVGMGAPGLFSVVLVGGVEGRGYGKVGRTEGLGVETGCGESGFGTCRNVRKVRNVPKRVERIRTCRNVRNVPSRTGTCRNMPENTGSTERYVNPLRWLAPAWPSQRIDASGTQNLSPRAQPHARQAKPRPRRSAWGCRRKSIRGRARS